MTAPEPSIELQPQQQQQKEQQPRDNGDDNQQQRAGDRLSNIGTAQSSLGIEPVPTRMGKSTDSIHGVATSPDFRTWSPKNPSTTVDSEIPSWPFQEDHQPKPPNQPPNVKPAPRPSHLRHILRHWYLEILTIFVSTVLMTAIIVLLSTYNGKQMPEWPFSINLNTVIATLSTFLRAAMLAAVAEIIGQVKWTWFTERTRPLHHLQDFDSASRSMLGSMRLLGVVLWNYGWTAAGFLGSAAALVTIMSLAVGPFTQQALKTTTCPITVPNATAAIPAAYYVPGSSSYYRTGAGMFEVEVDMKSAMIEGLTYPDGKDNDVETTCDGSNCTWPDFGTGVTHATIGLCSACINTTDYVTGPSWGGNLTLPDYEAYINYQRGQYMWVGYSNLTWASDSFTEEFASAASVAVSNFSMLVATTSPCTKRPNSGFYDCPHNVSSTDYYNGLGGYIATSCTLYPCMKEYYGFSLGSRFRERLVRTSTAVPNKQETSGYTAYYNYTAIRSPCILEDGITFNTSNLTHSLLEAGTWYTTTNMSYAPHVAGRTWANITLEDSKGNDYNTSVPNACLYKMDAIYASALQYFMSYTLFTGSCYYDSSHSTCTYFDWRWVSFPAVLVFICALLLGWTLIKNYRDPDQPVWKGSVLPLIFLGLHDPGVAPGAAMQPGPRGLRRLDSMQNFIRENGRSAPELGRIKEDAGRMWVRFHGGNEPGFMELGSKKNTNLDAEASAASLLAANTMPAGRDVKWSEVELRSVRRARSSTMI
ncbi:hypothetical protein VP1G_07183 [Cytospora mali]|uniref:Uncharacterized protein n=1 Tax=Cytospora mali TaxID=578113 RepID=A0A194V7T0_CYTMA|nr:hypothetical protein VP1G_07183 [Valsa mali var. pyri (nom. inval.)]